MAGQDSAGNTRSSLSSVLNHTVMFYGMVSVWFHTVRSAAPRTDSLLTCGGVVLNRESALRTVFLLQVIVRHYRRETHYTI